MTQEQKEKEEYKNWLKNNESYLKAEHRKVPSYNDWRVHDKFFSINGTYID